MARFVIFFYGSKKRAIIGKAEFAGTNDEIAGIIANGRKHWTGYEVIDLQNARITECGDF